MSRLTWNTLARAALERGKECPDEEALRRWSEGPDLTAESEQEGVAAHVSRCARCRFEIEEMGVFFADRHANQDAAQQIEVTLRTALAAQKETGRDVPDDSPAGAGSWRLVAAAALAVLAAAALWMLRESPPEVPALNPGAGAARGSESPAPVAPLGGLTSAPVRLAWRTPADVAGPWVVRVETVDGRLLWTASTSANELPLPHEVRARLQPGSRYIWRVGPEGAAEEGEAATFWIGLSAADPAPAVD